LGNAVHPDDSEVLQLEWQQAATREAEPFTCEFRLRRGLDGEYRWMLSTAVPLSDSFGSLNEWVGSLTDIDDQKRQSEILERMVHDRTVALVDEIQERTRAEQQARAVAVELERSNRELQEFAYIASHDLQEPLRKIQAFGDRLQKRFRVELPEAGQDYVDRMNDSASRMRRLIDDLLNYSRVTTQALPFRKVDLNKLVREVISDLDELVTRQGATIKCGPLPTVAADQTQMHQLFQNLIVNAVKFHKPGLPPVIEIVSEQMGVDKSEITRDELEEKALLEPVPEIMVRLNEEFRQPAALAYGTIFNFFANVPVATIPGSALSQFAQAGIQIRCCVCATCGMETQISI
jgi:signal transduction histidine kinase